MSLTKRRSVYIGTICAWPSAILFALTLLGENQALTAEEDATTDAIKDHVPKPGSSRQLVRGFIWTGT